VVCRETFGLASDSRETLKLDPGCRLKSEDQSEAGLGGGRWARRSSKVDPFGAIWQGHLVPCCPSARLPRQAGGDGDVSLPAHTHGVQPNCQVQTRN